MTRLPSQPAAEPAVGGPGPERLPGQEHQALWFALASRRIASVVLVPADEGSDLSGLARALAEVGRRLGDTPVTAVVPEAIDYDFVNRTAALLALTRGAGDRRPGASLLEVIVAIHPVTVEPLGLALVHAADAAILCVEQGKTRLAAARRTLKLIGKDRFIGSVLLC